MPVLRTSRLSGQLQKARRNAALGRRPQSWRFKMHQSLLSRERTSPDHASIQISARAQERRLPPPPSQEEELYLQQGRRGLGPGPHRRLRLRLRLRHRLRQPAKEVFPTVQMSSEHLRCRGRDERHPPTRPSPVLEPLSRSMSGPRARRCCGTLAHRRFGPGEPGVETCGLSAN